jgi:hypothetical protein
LNLIILFLDVTYELTLIVDKRLLVGKQITRIDDFVINVEIHLALFPFIVLELGKVQIEFAHDFVSISDGDFKPLSLFVFELDYCVRVYELLICKANPLLMGRNQFK